MTSRRALLTGLGLAPLAIMAQPYSREVTHAEPCMGTLFRVITWADDEALGYQAIRRAFERAHQLDAKLSDYRADSELMRLQREGNGEPFRVSEDLFRVVAAAQRIATESEGLFDITIGPLSRLWRQSRDSNRLPDPAALREARGKVGHRLIRLHLQHRRIELLAPGMQLDLGGIAKGYAADAMLQTMRAAGYPRTLVAAGGDIAAGDPPQAAGAWRVLVMPGESAHEPHLALSLTQMAVSTSGAHRQHVTIDGRDYSHIVDPRTGLGLTKPAAVTVVAPTATESDALATAACVMDSSRAIAFLTRRSGVHGRVFLPALADGESPRTLDTPGFGNLVWPSRGA